MIPEILSLLGVLTLGLLSPGPDFLVIVKNSLGGSRASALATVAGIALGLAVQLTIIVLGFAAAPPGVLRAVQWIGAAFLACVGVRTLFAKVPAENAGNESRTSGAATVPSTSTTASAPGGEVRRGFVEGLLCNLTNPKAFLFFVSLFAQFARGENESAWRVLFPVLGVGHALVAWTGVVLAVQSKPVASRLRRAQRWLPRVFGAALLGLALWTSWGAWTAK